MWWSFSCNSPNTLPADVIHAEEPTLMPTRKKWARPTLLPTTYVYYDDEIASRCFDEKYVTNLFNYIEYIHDSVQILPFLFYKLNCYALHVKMFKYTVHIRVLIFKIFYPCEYIICIFMCQFVVRLYVDVIWCTYKIFVVYVCWHILFVVKQRKMLTYLRQSLLLPLLSSRRPDTLLFTTTITMMTIMLTVSDV
jgi:hypothetical protein